MTEAVSQTVYIFSGVEMRCLLTGRDTGGAFCLFENRSPGASGTPVHLHQLDDETLIVIEGEMRLIVAGESRTIVCGEAAFLPRGVPHQLRNESGLPSRYLILCSPSGFENFVASAGHHKEFGESPQPPTPSEIKRLLEVAPNFGITILPRP